MHITQENHAIKAQLSELMELVHQLLPQQPPAAQATQQAADPSKPSSGLPLAKGQFPGTTEATLNLPPPSWSQPQEAALGEPLQHQDIMLPCLQCLPQWHHHRIGPFPSPACTLSLSALPCSVWAPHMQSQVPVISS